MWSVLAAYLDMPPYTTPAQISSAVKIPEGLELAKCGRVDCNGYILVREKWHVIRSALRPTFFSLLRVASCLLLRVRAWPLRHARGRGTRRGRPRGTRLLTEQGSVRRVTSCSPPRTTAQTNCFLCSPFCNESISCILAENDRRSCRYTPPASPEETGSNEDDDICE
jgi:hypothetical protein